MRWGRSTRSVAMRGALSVRRLRLPCAADVPKKPPKKKKRAPPTELTKLKRQLAEITPGGTPGRPIEVVSASVVELAALDRECIGCGGQPKLVDHTVIADPDRSLRAVRVRCPRCDTQRTLFVEIVRPAIN